MIYHAAPTTCTTNAQVLDHRDGRIQESQSDDFNRVYVAMLDVIPKRKFFLSQTKKFYSSCFIGIDIHICQILRL